MREIRTSGSEGGTGTLLTGPPYPYRGEGSYTETTGFR